MAHDTPVIIVFDSGLGGVTILRKILQRGINCDLIYVADNLFVPYGSKSKDFIERRVHAIFLELNKKYFIHGAVIACNTATACASNKLRENFNFPIICMEPGIKPAIAMTISKNIGILATEGTIKSSRFNALIDRFVSDEYHLTIIPGNGLVELIEQIPKSKNELIQKLKPIMAKFIEDDIDVLVLGCTHYPIIVSLIKNLIPAHVKILDTSDAVVDVLFQRINFEKSENFSTKINLMNSREDKNYSKKLEQLIEVKQINPVDFIKIK